jgi:predicted cupin superfamily sugar epimerase
VSGDAGAEDLVRLLGLEPLAREGGRYRETWRSPERVPTPAGERSLSTAILYLLSGEERSALHRLRFDEVWHWHLGGPVDLTVVPPDGPPETVRLGPDLAAGMRLQAVVPAGAWQGARLAPGVPWALLGTTMSPGFDPADFELADPEVLAAAHPAHAPLLRSLGPRA